MIGTCKGIILALLFSFAGYTLLASGPVPFVENKNQWPGDFRFGADFPQMRVMLKDASIFFIQHTVIKSDSKSKKKLRTDPSGESHVHGDGERSIATFELKFLGALNASIVASKKQKTIYNYFYGNDPSKWASKAGAYEEVLYSGIYTGIDLKVYSQGEQMKYDWVVSPCADVRNIRFEYEGAEYVGIRDENLVIQNKLGEVVETKPYAYQEVNGQRRAVAAAFEIDDDVVSFVFPEGYDSNYELVIDPFLIFSSYSGSTLDNWGNTATPDSQGNLYSGGMVETPFVGATFPVTPGAFQTTHAGGEWDVGILKYDSIGANLLYVTYLGGKGVETPQSLVVNSNDELFVLGATSSNNFPKATNTFKGGSFVDPLNGVDYNTGTDIFIAHLSVDGSNLLGSTYLGGSGNDGINFVSGDMGNTSKVESPLSRNYGDQLRGDIITDDNGNIYIASNTRSTDFPFVNTDPTANFHGGTHDAIVVKLNPDLSIAWSRLFGGTGTDAAFSIKFTQTGNILVAGGTTSTDVPGMNGLRTTAPGSIDGWIAEISAAGDQVINGTYIGTNAYDQVYFVDVATNGDILVYGQTQGQYPISNNVYSNPGGGQFLHRLSPNLKSTVFSTVFGKGGFTPDISPTAFLVNACDNIYMAGWGGFVNDPNHFGVHTNYVGGNTTGLPVTSDAWQKNSFGNDFYFMVLTGNGQELVYATFLGGTISPTHVDGGTSRFDKRGVVYQSVCAGCGGFESDFPSFNVPPARSQNRSNNCNNAAFKFDLSSLHAGLQTNNIALTNPGLNRICIPDSIVFQNLTIGGEIFEWDFGDGGPRKTYISKDNIKHYYKKPGQYTVKLKAIDHSTCIGEDSVSTVVLVTLPDMHAGPDLDVCFGSSTQLSATGAALYSWKTVDNSFTSSAQDPVVTPGDTTLYILSMVDAEGCTRKDSLQVNVVAGIDLAFDFERIYDCQSRPNVHVKNTSKLKDDEQATFLFGDGNSSEEIETIHTYEHDNVYPITLRATKEFCTYEVSKVVPVVTLRIPNVITPGAEDGLNDTFKVAYGDPPLTKTTIKVSLKIMDRWGVRVFETNDYKDDWNGAGLDEGVYYFEAEIPGEVQCKGWVHLIK